MGVIPEGPRLVKDVEIIEKGRVLDDGALRDHCAPVCPIGTVLENTVPML